MRIRRSLPIVLPVLLVAAAVSLAVLLRKQAPPEPARLLPGADAFVYVNLQWMRRVSAVPQLPAVPHEPEYEQFLRETGFQFERDLEEAAFAVHYPTSPAGPNPRPLRFTEVFVGKIQDERLTAYLRKIASSVDSYRSVDIYSVPLEGRTVRVALLAVNMVAVSNHDDPQVIRGIVDRSRRLASPFGGPSFLRQYYRHVPLASLAWAIARVDSSPDSRSLLSLGGWSLLSPKPAVVVASARYLTALNFKAEAFTASEEDARRLTEQLTTFLSLFHTAEDATSAQGGDADVKAFFDSLQVEQKNERAVLSATVPLGFIRKVLAEPPPPPAPAPAPQQEKAGPLPSPHKKSASRK